MRLLAVLAALVWTWSGCQEAAPDAASAPPARPRVEVAGSEPPASPSASPARPDAALQAYLVDAELALAPLSRQVRAGEPEEHARARYQAIAGELAERVAVDGPGAFPREPADVAAAHLGVVLVAIAAHETGYLLALDGDSAGCTPALGGCDGSLASSILQVHAPRGHDRAYYVRLASSIAARSLHETGGLCWYSGEGALGDGCPKAKMMMGIASGYWRAHAWVAR